MSTPTVLFERIYETTRAVSALHIETAATFVFASVRPVKAPTIVLHCDSDELANAFKVVESGSTLTLGWKSHIAGRYFVEVHVPAQSISCVKKTSSGVAAVHPGVLKHSGDVTLRSSGSGTLLVQDDVIEASHLSVQQAGSGRIQLETAAVVISGAIKTEVSGSGNVAIVANTVAASYMEIKDCGSGDTFVVVQSTANITDHVKIEVAASGGVNIVSDAFSSGRLHSQVMGSGSIEVNTHSQFFAATVESQVAGSGTIQVVGQGSAGHHKVEIMGSGKLNSTINATAVEVKIAGSGGANFSDASRVSAKIFGSGAVRLLTLVRLKPSYQVVAMPVPAPTNMAESAGSWFKKAFFG